MIFYVYGITVGGVVSYVGKGSGDRILTYFTDSLSGVTPYARKKLEEARCMQSEIGVLILDTSQDENLIFDREAIWIRRYGIDNLWNLTTGGRSGWAVVKSLRAIQSMAQKDRAKMHGAARKAHGHLLTDLEKMPKIPTEDRVQRHISAAEGNALNLPAGLVWINQDQSKKLKDYRFLNARRL